MKRLVFFAALLVFISCKKELNQSNRSTAALEAQTTSGSRDIEPIPAPNYRWTNLPGALPPPPHDLDGQNIVMTADGKVYCVRGFAYDRELFELNTTTISWAASNDFVFGEFSQYMFSHGTKIYQGLVMISSGSFPGMQSIDVNTGVVTTVAAFPGTIVGNFTSFVIGGKGYLLGGSAGGVPINQFWEYNFLTNQWTNKGNSPLGKRAGAYCFVSGGKAYFGGGYDQVNLNGTQVKVYKNDWIQFTPGSPFTATKANFPGTRRTSATGYVQGELIFMGFGYNSSNAALKDFWYYRPSSDGWLQMPSWTGTLTTSNTFGGFYLGDRGYIVKGALADFRSFRAGYFARGSE